MLRLTILVAIVTSCLANSAFEFVNNCAYTVWVGILGTTNPAGGGFQLNSRTSRTVGVDDHWRGRMWGRTFCDNSGHCQTGDCGNRIQCNGAGGVPPATLAEFTLKGHAGLDFYDVSLVDGYNLMMKVTPKAGTYDPNGGAGLIIASRRGARLI